MINHKSKGEDNPKENLKILSNTMGEKDNHTTKCRHIQSSIQHGEMKPNKS